MRLRPRPLVALCLLLLIAACGGGRSTTLLSGSAFGTGWTVQFPELPPGVAADTLTERIVAALDEVDRAMSTWRDDAEIVRFNEAPAGTWFAVSPAVVEVVEAAAAVSELSGGAFDITVAPLVSLWGFGAAAGERREPDAAALAAARARVGYELIGTRAQPPALIKRQAGVSIDLSAIAKGYAVDRVARLLTGLGVNDYLVEIGGELRAAGRNAAGVAWRVAVERPDAAGREATEIVPLADRAVATSGDYRNVYERDGQRYSHTIDPRTGAPVQHRLASVTVIDRSAMRADALATALLALGPQEGMQLAERAGVAALFIERVASGYAFLHSAAMERYLASVQGSGAR